jgi:precorrin-2 methylase
VVVFKSRNRIRKKIVRIRNRKGLGGEAIQVRREQMRGEAAERRREHLRRRCGIGISRDQERTTVLPGGRRHGHFP